MRRNGKLKLWEAERGFGFIDPGDGSPDLFVHISAFAHGMKPVAGEALSYELGQRSNGKPQAVRVERLVVRSKVQPRPQTSSRRPVGRGIVLGLLLLACVVGYSRLQPNWSPARLVSPVASEARSSTDTPSPPQPSYTCDGRTHCSQMTSCSEAKYFLQHCPGTKMDGNGDGVPCEQQWCTSPFAR